jgi:hypothetical protein
MTIARQVFDLTDTGTMTDAGPSAMGRVEQYRWAHQSGDTGGSIELGIYPRRDDTGDGWLILSGGLSPQLRGSFNPTDTGVAVHMAGDRLRVRKTGSAGTGRLYVWIKS